MRLTLVASTAVLVTACSSATEVEPEPQPTAVNPQLVSLEFAASDLTPHEVLKLVAVLAPGETVSDSEFVPVSVASSGGRHVTARLTEMTCNERDVVCDRIWVKLRSGYSVDSIQDLFVQLGAQPFLVWPDFDKNWVSIQLLDFDRAGALEKARNHPAVELAGEVGILHLHVVPAPGPDPGSVIRTTIGTAPWITGALTISSGDSITATYNQPDGSTVAATALIY